ncbi:protein roadkill-like isoform X2 [Leptopilina heterotoma]|uniref:protein roadkill-like isoform X2 n=1 Tax=Leptopilina heterotoma TaxID=63436 RepID=UPI001CA8802F|nr:protein roadkill-like isoform X2 [Leptopilina heterotoma]
MSKFQCETYTLRWKVCDFLIACENKSLIKSSLFPKEKVDNVQWCLEVQFTKLSKDNQDIFQFSLINTESIRKNVCINISIFSNEKIKKIINSYPSCDIITKWEIKATELYQVLVFDNRLPTNIVIFCEVVLMKEVKSALKSSSSSLARTLQSNELLSQLKNSISDEAFKDVIFKVEDETFTAHKFILALRSPVFAIMFKNHVVEKLMPVFKVEDMRATIFQKVLQFIYTDNVEDIDDLVFDLFCASEKYELDNLKIMCINNLYANLSCETVIKTLELADIFSISKLKEESLRFLVTNLATISCKEDFVALIKKRENLSVEIFKMFGSMNNEKENDNNLLTDFSSLFDDEDESSVSTPDFDEIFGMY